MVVRLPYTPIWIPLCSTIPTVDRNDPCDPRENSKNFSQRARVGPHAQIGLVRVTHIAWPKIYTPVWNAHMGPHAKLGLARVAHTPHSHHHTAVSCARPCSRPPHGCVSHTANHIAKYTPMWHRQCGFLAFAVARFFE
ncbi:hypothetical protein PVK06_005603 [Gossypium arboreum]|uniref:Secreted protein n=1 Tax=Gossypium arboreum TaxID=29729 RepID=A0ABR0QV15_GOSAR|nr:hypothetical protein PVK06_005603 [Gossypium arboreum]